MMALVDYGMGNLRSVEKAFHSLGFPASVLPDPDLVAKADAVVLPGVGAFAKAMDALTMRGMDKVLREVIEEGKPFLGICLGYQILFGSSEETPEVAGLGLVPGSVRRFKQTPGLKIPHMGWNSVVPRKPDTGHWAGLGAEPYFYYVHSYFPVPDDRAIIAAETTYGDDTFAAAIELPNLLACQFHPEKSQDAGLRLIRNFLAI